MIYLILKSYLTIILSVATSSILLLLLGMYWIFKPEKNPSSFNKVLQTSLRPIAPENTDRQTTVSASDLNAIAGESIFATQLDLARAYMEAGKLTAAKKILNQVFSQGNETERQEAEYLLGSL